MHCSANNAQSAVGGQLQDEVARLRAEVTGLHHQIDRQQRQIDSLTRTRDELSRDLTEALTQMNGGDADPRECPSHPGAILLRLGWTYHPAEHEDEFDPDQDYEGLTVYCWSPPRAYLPQGGTQLHTLVGALHIEYKRLEAGFRAAYPTAFERLADDD